MIFVTVGSQKFQFDRLLKEIDLLIKNGIIEDKVFAQTGVCTYRPQNYAYQSFLNKDEFNQKMDESDTVITHGGTGAIMGAVKRGKRVIAVARLAQYGEHVDDHQKQILEEFRKLGIIISCPDVSNLAEALDDSRTKKLVPYVSNTKAMINDIDAYIVAIANRSK